MGRKKEAMMTMKMKGETDLEGISMLKLLKRIGTELEEMSKKDMEDVNAIEAQTEKEEIRKGIRDVETRTEDAPKKDQIKRRDLQVVVAAEVNQKAVEAGQAAAKKEVEKEKRKKIDQRRLM